MVYFYFLLTVDDGMAVNTEVAADAVVTYIASTTDAAINGENGSAEEVVAAAARFEPLSSPYADNSVFVSNELVLTDERRLLNAEIVSSLSQSDEHLPLMAMTQAEALIMDVDSPQILAELAFTTTVESRTPAVVQATTTQVFDVGTTRHNNNANETNDSDDDELDDSDTGTSSSPDLSRLIIQQVPKRLERLKSENEAMKEREQLLLDQVDEQRLRIETLEMENKSMSERLNQEMNSKEEVISCLRTEIADLASRMNRYDDQMHDPADFFEK